MLVFLNLLYCDNNLLYNYLLCGKDILWSTIGQSAVCNFLYGLKRFYVFTTVEKLPYNKHLVNLICLIRTVNYGSSFPPTF
jgi:hypothetical protein